MHLHDGLIYFTSVSKRQIVELRAGGGRILKLNVAPWRLLAVLCGIDAPCHREGVEVGDVIHHPVLLPPVAFDAEGDSHILPEP